MGTGVRSRYHIAINSKGFMLRGAPGAPVYQKERAPAAVSQLGLGDKVESPLTGSGWSYWTQTDWSGGFHTIKFKDDASFKDGQAVDVLKKYGEISLQHGWTSAFVVASGYTAIGARNVNNGDLLLGVSAAAVSAKVKVLKVTSAHTVTALSAMTSALSVNGMTRFKDDTVVALTRTTGASSAYKTMTKYNGSVLSGFRAANPAVRSVHSVGIRLYSGERVQSLSGDVLYYSTDLSTFTSAYQAGKNRQISAIDDINGSPYFFVKEDRKVDLFSWDEVAERAYQIYTWDDLTDFSVRKYLSSLVITGKSNGESVAFGFNGARISQIFDDQLQDANYDMSDSFEFESNLQTKSASYDGTLWVPGMYGLLNATHRYKPYVNFANRAYGYVTSGASKTYFGYRDTTKYNISGHVISSEFGAEIGGVDKLVNAAIIDMEELATGETIEVLRSTDGGDTFTTIGKASYAQDGGINNKILNFPSGFVTKLWNYKVQIVGPGTSTPTVKGVSFQYRPMADLKKRWRLSVDAGNHIKRLDRTDEERDGKALMQDLWLEMEAKRSVQFEDVDAFQVDIVSAMAADDTSARVADTRLMPPRGRMRAKVSGVIEEMTYTSADGGRVLGISRAQKSTIARAYTSAHKLDNYYNVIVTNITEVTNNTDERKTESIAQIVMLET